PPVALLLRELRPSGPGQPVVAGLAIILGRSPFALDPAALLQPPQRWKERPRLHHDRAPRHLLDARRHADAVYRLELERPQNQKIERSLQNIHSELLGIYHRRSHLPID